MLFNKHTNIQNEQGAKEFTPNKQYKLAYYGQMLYKRISLNCLLNFSKQIHFYIIFRHRCF